MRRSKLILATLLFTVGCDIQDTTPVKPTKSVQACAEVSGSIMQLRQAVGNDLATDQFPCLEQHIDVARASPPDEELAKLARRALDRSDLPDSTAVFALSYLVLVDATDPKSETQAHVSAIRRVAKDGTGKTRTTAIALLSSRRDDDDLEILRGGVKSGNEAVLAYSVFGMANNCSLKARAALREALSSEEVKSYIAKYPEKESITATVKRDCPGAMG